MLKIHGLYYSLENYTCWEASNENGKEVNVIQCVRLFTDLGFQYLSRIDAQIV